MPWSIIQIKKKKGKKSYKVIDVAPSGWIKNGFVYWPSHNQVTLQRDEKSKISLDDFAPHECKVFFEGLLDFDEADKKANEYKPTQSDVEHTHSRKSSLAYNIDDGTGLHSLPVSSNSLVNSLDYAYYIAVSSRLCVLNYDYLIF